MASAIGSGVAALDHNIREESQRPLIDEVASQVGGEEWTPDSIQPLIQKLGARMQNSSDQWEKDITYLEIARLYIKVKDFDSAITMASCIEDVSRQPMAMQEIANVLMKLDNHPFYNPLKKALEAAIEMTNKDRKERAITGIFEESIRRSDFEISTQIFQITKDEPTKCWMRKQIFKKSLVFYGFDLILAAMSTTVEKSARDEQLNWSFNYFSEIRDCNAALKILDKMEDSKKTGAIGSLARVFTEDGRIEDALKVLAKLEDRHTRDNFSIEIAEVSIEADQQALGFDWKR